MVLRFALLMATAAIAAPLMAADAPIRVLIWDEQQPEQKQAYGDLFLGETIAAHLAKQEGITVKTTSLASPDQGITPAALDQTDVLIWWGHKRHQEVTAEHVEAIVSRVTTGRLGFIALHSAHWSQPFIRLMQERAKTDALAQVPEAERATAKWEYLNAEPRGKMPGRAATLTPYVKHGEDGVWHLTLPACVFPAVRADGAPGHLKTLLPQHPIAAGLPAAWDIPRTEMYGGPFHVPAPDATLFEETWDKGESFTSGCAWQVGKNRVFYFRPGHETFPIYLQKEPLRVVVNAVRWVAPK